MKIRTLTIGALALALLAAAGLLVLQRRDIRRLNAEVADLRTQPNQMEPNMGHPAPNKRIEPMTSSAVCRWFQFHVVSALLVTAHPQRWKL